MAFDSTVDQFEPGRLESHAHHSPIIWIAQSRDESFRFETIDTLGYCARGEHRRVHEFAGGEFVRLSVPPQSGQHIKLRWFQVELRQARCDLPIENLPEARQSTDHVHRSRVEIGPLESPLFEDHINCVDAFRHHGILPISGSGDNLIVNYLKSKI